MRIGYLLVLVFIVSMICASLAEGLSFHGSPPDPLQVKSSDVQFMSVEELKAKVVRNQPVTIIDVRPSEAFVNSDRKIKGAVHVKLRRLKFRLDFPPLKDVSKDREVVTYCACSDDELSIQAAQVLLESGFKPVRALKGGWQAWRKLGGPVEPVAKGM